MHFWEHSPQDCTVSRHLTLQCNQSLTSSNYFQALIKRVGAGMWFSMRETFQSCDGQILASPEIYEPEAIAVYKEWFATKGRPVWAVGPLLPLAASTHAIAGESTLSENAADIKKFMDGVFTTHGEKSMLYVSPSISHTYMCVLLHTVDTLILNIRRSPSAPFFGLLNPKNSKHFLRLLLGRGYLSCVHCLRVVIRGSTCSLRLTYRFSAMVRHLRRSQIALRLKSKRIAMGY